MPITISAIELVAVAGYSGQIVKNDGARASYAFIRQPDGKFVRRYENLEKTKTDGHGKVTQPELDRFNAELGDMIEGRRAWPTKVRFILASAVPAMASEPPKTILESQVATGADDSHEIVEPGSIPGPATLSQMPTTEAEVNASMHNGTLRRIAKEEGVSLDGLKTCAEYAAAILSAREARHSQAAA